MTSKCRAVIAPSLPALIKALQAQGFFLPTAMPGLPHRIEVRGDMLVVRFA